MIRRVAATALLLCALSAPAAAGDTTALPAKIRLLPVAYRALWAMPSCADPRRVVLYSAAFRLEAFPDAAHIAPAAVTAQGDGYIKTNEGGTTLFLETTPDSRLQRTALKIPNGVWPGTLDPGNPALSVTLWERCKKAPPWPSLPAAALTALARLDDIRASCDGESLTPSCADALFAAADDAGDGALDYRDIAFGWQRLRYLAAAQQPDCAFTAQFPGDSAHAGPAHAARIIAAYDRNGDGKLSRIELPSFAAEETYPALLPLRALIPAFAALPSAEEKCRP